jgi:BirA family biotin operon repressor/biotin-[acetyl-CoA-carboxylase] ligase
MTTMAGCASMCASLNIPLLERLRAAAGESIPLEELGPDGDRVRADLDALAAFGFAIERHPYRGASYTGPAERLCPDQIEHALATSRVGHRIAVWSRVSSTNDLAAQAVGSTSNDGLVILAEEQTAGRGRLGRSWTAPPRSSILMSVLIFPTPSLDLAGPDAGRGSGWLTALGAVATAEVVSTWIGREAAIKWPNDVRVEGRKIAGILVERPSARGRPDSPASARNCPSLHGPTGSGQATVIGIGLNVNFDRDALPAELEGRATSIRIERGGLPVDRSEVARDLIRRLDYWYDAVRSQGSAALNAPWRDRNELLGQAVRVSTPSGPHSGRLIDLDVRLGLTLDLAAEGADENRHPTDDRDAAAPRRIRLRLAEVSAIEPISPSSEVGSRPWTEDLPKS